MWKPSTLVSRPTCSLPSHFFLQLRRGVMRESHRVTLPPSAEAVSTSLCQHKLRRCIVSSRLAVSTGALAPPCVTSLELQLFSKQKGHGEQLQPAVCDAGTIVSVLSVYVEAKPHLCGSKTTFTRRNQCNANTSFKSYYFHIHLK